MGLRGRHMRLVTLVLAFSVCLPTLGLGFMLDDHVMRAHIAAHLRAGLPDIPRALDLFNLSGDPNAIAAHVRSGDFPWWTSHALVLRFFRPLAVVTHYVDYALFGLHAWPMHLHNVLWYVLLVALAALAYQRFLPPAAAALAASLYAIDDAHVEGVGWIASRNTLMTAVFVLATLYFHDRARRGVRLPKATRPFTCASPEGPLGSRALAPLALACALLSSEGGTAAWALLVPYVLFVERAPWSERLRSLDRLLAVTLVWAAFYALAGYGARGGDAYVDPLGAPRAFVERLPLVMPALVNELFGAPAMWLARHPSLAPWAKAVIAR